MADTSLNENRLGLLIWQTTNIWQSKLRKILKKHKISLNEYLIIETLFKLSSLTNIVSQISIANNSFLDVSVVSTNLTLLENKNLIFLEINTQPGLTPLSLVPEQLSFNNINFTGFIDQLINSSL